MISLKENGYQNRYLPARKPALQVMLFSLCLLLEGGIVLQVYFHESVSRIELMEYCFKLICIFLTYICKVMFLRLD